MMRIPAGTKRSGFTLIELLVVIAIIAILAAILFPVFAQARTAAKKTVTMSNMKNIGLGAVMYTSDNNEGYMHAVGGGCTGEANAANSLWGRQMYPYVKNLEVFTDSMSSRKSFPMRFQANVAATDVGLQANQGACNDTNTDRRAASIGINRTFLAYFACDDASQVGCTAAIWGDEPLTPENNASCVSQYTNVSMIRESSKYVTFATTNNPCSAGAQGYLASPQNPINVVDGLTNRNGEGLMVAFADGSAKFFPAREDQQLSTALGVRSFISPVQNRPAVLRRAGGASNRANGTQNCVNINSANIHWNVFVPLPGENPTVDALCR